jgi:aryl-phospho-beta-D-glucosidase BglC (GH1 family)
MVLDHEMTVFSLLHRSRNGYSYLSDVLSKCKLSTEMRLSSTDKIEKGVAQSNSQHIQTACSAASELSSFDLWVIVGEWTPAVTDCAKYLNGRGVGARYDGTFPGSTRVGSCTGLTGSASSFSSSFKTFLRQMWEAQVQTFEKGQGWIQWDWKNENADEWSYKVCSFAHVDKLD